MTVSTKEKLSSTEGPPVNWHWVGALFALALLGVMLDSKMSPENVRFIGNPLTCVGTWGAVLCVLFMKEKAKPEHPHQAGIVLAIDARGVATFTLIIGHLASIFRFGFSAVVNLIIGAIVFLIVLLLRYESGIPLGMRSWLGKRCRICGALIIHSYDIAITKDPARPIVAHCHICGTNCDGPISQPLTATAQEFLDGNKANYRYDNRLPVESSNIPPNPVPFPYDDYFKRLSKVIGLIIAGIFTIPFFMMFLMGGPYLTLKWILVLFGMTLFVFAASALFGKPKAPCPHCQANLIDLAFGRGPLGRGLRYRKHQGHYAAEAIPRYCPYCGKNIEEPAEKH